MALTQFFLFFRIVGTSRNLINSKLIKVVPLMAVFIFSTRYIKPTFYNEYFAAKSLIANIQDVPLSLFNLLFIQIVLACRVTSNMSCYGTLKYFCDAVADYAMGGGELMRSSD